MNITLFIHKYNKAKHSVVEQQYDLYSNDMRMDYRGEPLHIPVSGEVDWKDGEDVTGKFRIGRGVEQYDDAPDREYDVAIPIKQEQPDNKSVLEEIYKNASDFGKYVNQSQEQQQEGFLKNFPKAWAIKTGGTGYLEQPKNTIQYLKSEADLQFIRMKELGISDTQLFEQMVNSVIAMAKSQPQQTDAEIEKLEEDIFEILKTTPHWVTQTEKIVKLIAGWKAKEAALQKIIQDKDKEICDLLDWGNGLDEALEKLEKKIKELEDD